MSKVKLNPADYEIQGNRFKGFQGLSAKGLKKHRALIPLHISISVGMLFAAAYTVRLAVKNPDVTWSQVRNPEPWQHLGLNGQYKFWSSHDYSKITKPEGKPDF